MANIWFKDVEWECHCRCGCGIKYMDEGFVRLINKFRELINKPIILTSPYRCLVHNKNEGGLNRYKEDGIHRISFHCHGLASDIRVRPVTVLPIIFKIAIADNNFKGVLYSPIKNFIHVDIGTTFRRISRYKDTGGTEPLKKKEIDEIMGNGVGYYLKQLGV